MAALIKTAPLDKEPSFTRPSSYLWCISGEWSEMHPGEVTNAKVQSQITEELENSAVRVVVLVDIPSGFEDNSSAISSGIYILDTLSLIHISEPTRPY